MRAEGLSRGVARTLKFGAVVMAVGFIAVVPGRSAILDSGPAATTGPVDQGPAGPAVTDTGPRTGPVRTATDDKPGLQCTRSLNGGATDQGVTESTIYLASTVVSSGAGKSFLGDSPLGMQAVVRKVNAAGGICGRLLDLTLRDDGWNAPRGLDFLKNFIDEQKYFAFPVVPSSEGLTAAIEAGVISKAGIPVVGTDGMLRQQYEDPWVWPVATATESTMRIMAKHGYDKGSRCFGIVYDKFYRFGKEGAEAFRKYVATLKGARVCADVGILPAQASYSSEIQNFNAQCDGQCDLVAWLLEPGTALTWVAGRPQFGTKVTTAAQTLFNEQFAANCGKDCNGVMVWTGYNPPIGNLAGLPDIQTYVNDIKIVSPTADTTNQFLEGSYLGMTVFVEALRRVGPNLTRERLRDVLNSESFKTDIATTLRWTAAKRHANTSAQAFSIVVAQGSFAGFKNEQTGFIRDPSL
ncbi:MAG TPA: ABC transporter substrate-binding protein [Actinomycetota bacterium]